MGLGIIILDGEIVHRGLLSNNFVPHMATSEDGLCTLGLDNHGEQLVSPCVLEFKTATEINTGIAAVQRLDRACVVSNQAGRRVFSVIPSSDIYQILIWKRDYRGQVLHHASTTKCNPASVPMDEQLGLPSLSRHPGRKDHQIQQTIKRGVSIYYSPRRRACLVQINRLKVPKTLRFVKSYRNTLQVIKP